MLRLSSSTWVLFAGLALGSVLAGCRDQSANSLEKPDAPHISPGVAMRDVSFLSAALGREMPYRVFLPAEVPAGQRLPVVYLLHGMGGNFRDWSNATDVSRYAAQGLILVMVEGEHSYYLNAAGRPKDRFEDYLTVDLVRDVEGRFPALTDGKHRALIGGSMGGFAGVKVALSHPEIYGFVGSLSAPLDAAERGFALRRWSQWWGFRELFGPWGSEARRERDPFVLVESAEPGVTPYLYLTVGARDPLVDANRRFVSRLKARGFRYEFHVGRGGHDWGEWADEMPGCFARVMETMLQK